MELDTLYCDVIVQRWEEFTGKKAQRITAAMTDTAPALLENTTGALEGNV
jgi:hypothetical protein